MRPLIFALIYHGCCSDTTVICSQLLFKTKKKRLLRTDRGQVGEEVVSGYLTACLTYPGVVGELEVEGGRGVEGRRMGGNVIL